MIRYVVDSSLTLAWYLEDEQDVYADAALAALTGGAEAVVPPLWRYEVANGLGMAVRRQRLEAAEIPRVLALLAPMPISVQVTADERVFQEVLALSQQEGLTVYAAAYLELALRERLPLATLNPQLREAADRAGVPPFKP